MIAQQYITRTIEIMAKVPGSELVAWKKIAMNGYPVGDSSADVRSLAQKSIAINMPNPRQPLIPTLSKRA